MNSTVDRQKELRVKVAELCGWTAVEWYEDNAGPGFWCGIPPYTLGVDKAGEWDANREQHSKHLPDYCNDLNAMHEAEESIKADATKWFDFGKHLSEITGNLHYMKYYCSSHFMATFAHATALQRAEAFVKTMEAK